MADGDLHHESFQQADELQSLRTQLSQFASQPSDAAAGLPGRHYVDEELFEHEKRTVLRHGWHCVGRADEISDAGDYLTAQILDEPIIVVRDGPEIRALSNVCRHRGMPLVQGNGHARLFVCPYHAWSYRTNGQLQRARASSLKSESMGFPRGRFCDSPYVEVDHGQIAITGYSGTCRRFG